MQLKQTLLFSAIVAITASSSANEFSSQIVNGSYADVTTYPSYIALFIDKSDYGGRPNQLGNHCGGTLLDKQHILTAAHCVYGYTSALLFTVAVPKLQHESDYPSNVIEKQMVNQIYYKSSYSSTTYRDDIAILKLATPLNSSNYNDFVKHPAVGDDALYRDSHEAFHAVGHGNTKSGADEKDTLQYAQLEYVDNLQCNVYNVDTSDNLCMGWSAPVDGLDNGTCQGDSGGPLYWYTGGEYVQVGITSFGPSTCGDPGVVPNSVFTEVLDHKDWIDSVLAGNETAKFTATDAARYEHVEASKPRSSESGGSTGTFTLLSLLLIAFRKRK